MYCCLNCGAIFEEPEKHTEIHGFTSPPYEEYLGCPVCGDGFVKTERCMFCGNYINDTYAETANGWICENCYTIKILGEE